MGKVFLNRHSTSTSHTSLKAAKHICFLFLLFGPTIWPEKPESKYLPVLFLQILQIQHTANFACYLHLGSYILPFRK